jgi:hypothetical protein
LQHPRRAYASTLAKFRFETKNIIADNFVSKAPCHAIILGIMGNLDKRAILGKDFCPQTPCFRGGEGVRLCENALI